MQVEKIDHKTTVYRVESKVAVRKIAEKEKPKVSEVETKETETEV